MAKINLSSEILPSGEFLYKKYWLEMGTARSLGKLQKWCIENGYVHKTTGKKPTIGAIWLKMWRWALRTKNLKEAEEVFNKASRDSGQFFTHEEWLEFLTSKAKCGSMLTINQYDKFVEATR